MDLILGITAVAGVALLIALQFRRKTGTDGMNAVEYDRLKAELDRKNDETTELKVQLSKAQSERDASNVKSKVNYDNFKNLESEVKMLHRERDGLVNRVKTFEADDARKEKEFTQRLEKLDAAKEKLEEERARVTHEDEERRKAELEARDRLWADHENAVVAALTDLCKLPQFNFTGFSNVNLPEGFDGSLKPDFMIDFLGQYVIFDAKVSKAKSLQTYVNDQVKKTVEKVKNDDRIYKSIFLVVPATALAELKTHHHAVDGYNIFIVSPEALPPILAAFKRMSMYELAEQLDPQQRENIVQMVADLDFHINLRNAADIILSKMGADILEKAQKIDPELAKEVALKKAPMNAKASIAAADIKKIVHDVTAQNVEIAKIVSPKASVRTSSLDDAQSLLSNTLL